MNTWHTLYHLVRADFLERVRRYSFLITLGLTILAGYLSVPAADAGYVTLNLGGYRGVYNSAWIGHMVAFLASIGLSLFGFYLVKNAVERDWRTGVGQIIATTPISKPLYILGKVLSNFAVLAAMVGILTVAAVAMQLLRGEEFPIDLWALAAPFLVGVLPAMAVVGALAVLFETISWLRGGFGNFVYFFLWSGMLMSDIAGSRVVGQGDYAPINDVLGIAAPLSSMTAAAKAAFPHYEGSVAIGVIETQGGLQTFHWAGVHWTAAIILGRLLWVGVALGIALVAARFFHRFDPARERRRPVHLQTTPPVVLEERAITPLPAQVHLTPLGSASIRSRFGGVLLAELRLMLKGLRWWWYLVALGLIVAGLFTPADAARQGLLPVAWIWPLAVWSAMGVREARYDTGQFVFSAPHPLRHQLPAVWSAGVMVALVTGSGVAIRLVVTGDGGGVFAWLVGALFIPSLALALGCWGGSSKLFEVVYTLLWYIGPVNQVPALDYVGASSASVAAGIPFIYLLSTVVLLGLAVAGRQRQLQL